MKLREDGLKSPIYHAVIVILFAVGLVSLPYNKLFCSFIENPLHCHYLSNALPRLIVSVIAVIFIAKYGFIKPFKSLSPKGLLLTIPALIVCINNFPIVGVITGNVVIKESGVTLLLYALYCLSIGLFEETVFRGIVFPLCYQKLKDKKLGLFFAVALSSAMFGATHLVNALAGMNIGLCLLQVGYSFLIGALCAVAVVITKNLFVAIFLHAVYDIGGMLLNRVGDLGIATGFQWDTLTVVITAVLGTICAIWTIMLLLKANEIETQKLFNLDNQSETN